MTLLNKIVTLGPSGTYSELATKNYLSLHNLPLDIIYYNSIGQSLNAIGKDASLGVLPIENFSEGFVNLVLDHLINAELYICAELLLPIQFSLVSHCDRAIDIDTVYVQFVAKGQCAEYLDALSGTRFVSTESNTQTLLEIEGNKHAAAVIPSHLLKNQKFSHVVENITDYKNNQTRFLLFSDQPNLSYNGNSSAYKTSILVFFHDDYPGFLEGVLNKFTGYKINLTSIVSRPTRQTFGHYHFFIDLEGHQQNVQVAAALKEVQQEYRVKVLGSYLKS
ncbi:MAG: prephenate dehydratase [Oceanospirillaceae bacterium]|jgi:prephenate dehydratase